MDHGPGLDQDQASIFGLKKLRKLQGAPKKKITDTITVLAARFWAEKYFWPRNIFQICTDISLPRRKIAHFPIDSVCSRHAWPQELACGQYVGSKYFFSSAGRGIFGWFSASGAAPPLILHIPSEFSIDPSQISVKSAKFLLAARFWAEKYPGFSAAMGSVIFFLADMLGPKN